jgi:hypothetical protein
MTPRRELAGVVTGVVLGAVTVLFAASRVWRVETQARPAPLAPVEVAHTGGSLVPAVPALGLVALACAGALIATRGRARAVVGGILCIAAAGMVVTLGAHLLRSTGSVGWVIVSLLGAVLTGLVGAVVLRRGAGWPSMGSRYARTPSTAPQAQGAPQNSPPSDTAIWDALDRGDDPTSGDRGEDPTGGDRDVPTGGDRGDDGGQARREPK